MKKRVLVTGATGNVGKEVINALISLSKESLITAGVRNISKENHHFQDEVHLQHFDFENESTFYPALSNCDILFLLRPPHIADVKKHFVPLIKTAKLCKIEHIVFLSVQGVENSRMIPHHKIEKLIVESNIPYTFIRPAYFMQNFTTTLHNDLLKRRMIFLPAGNAKFTLIDTRDVGLATAVVLANTISHINKSYELTNDEKLTFNQMAQQLSNVTGKKIVYTSPNLLSFFIQKRKENHSVTFILVMIMLHYLPRFQKSPQNTDHYKILTGRQPKSFAEFVAQNKISLIKNTC